VLIVINIHAIESIHKRSVNPLVHQVLGISTSVLFIFLLLSTRLMILRN